MGFRLHEHKLPTELLASSTEESGPSKPTMYDPGESLSYEATLESYEGSGQADNSNFRVKSKESDEYESMSNSKTSIKESSVSTDETKSAYNSYVGNENSKSSSVIDLNGEILHWVTFELHLVK